MRGGGASQPVKFETDYEAVSSQSENKSFEVVRGAAPPSEKFGTVENESYGVLAQSIELKDNAAYSVVQLQSAHVL